MTSEREQKGDGRNDRHIVLVVEPYAAGRRALRECIDQLGYAVVDVDSVEEARRLSSLIEVDLLVADYQPLQPELGALLAEMRARRPNLQAILLTGVREQITEIPTGSVLLTKPATLDDLERRIANVFGRKASPE